MIVLNPVDFSRMKIAGRTVALKQCTELTFDSSHTVQENKS
jgi:hypothetical protein